MAHAGSGEAPGYIVRDLEKLIALGRRFRTIVADPPWRYDQSPRGAAIHHYPTMSLEEIEALPVRELAEADAHLHLWTTHSFLREAFRVMEGWGFSFRSIFVWVKPTLGNGHYWRAAAEFMLFGMRGSLPFKDHGIINRLCAERGSHSAKPERIRRLIERVSPPPYLELFGRHPVDSWVVFGNQIERGLFDFDIEEIA